MTGKHHPHDIVGQQWNGEFSDKDSLQNLGLCYRVGHSDGRCPCPLAGPKHFIVFDITGPHSITINYCNCGEQPLSNWTQLLHERWFLATLSCPQTVFTFDCLESFHEITLQGKTSLYNYYHTLLRRSDNANIYTSIVSCVLLSSFDFLGKLNLFLTRTGTQRSTAFSECGRI